MQHRPNRSESNYSDMYRVGGTELGSTRTVCPTLWARSSRHSLPEYRVKEIKNSTPAYVARRVQDLLNRNSKAVPGASVLMLGVTYKPNIPDVRESPAAPLATCLIAAGANVSFDYPHVKNWTVARHDLASESDLYAAVADADAYVLLQDDQNYDLDELAMCSRRFLDTRGVVRRSATVERL